MTEAVNPRDPAALLPELRSGKRPPGDEVTVLLDRIEQFEPRIEALLADESAAERRARLLAEAHGLEKRWPDPATRPPLFGVVVGVKDLYHVAGFPTRAGSKLPPDLFSGADPADVTAESVRLLEEAGALVLGKTITTEFAYFSPGPTRNPWNTDHTPGGSSSGSAAAVAAGFCHIALGTQTIGSITRPASFCGLAGYKPSFGRISTAGIIPFSPNADHAGVIAPSARALEMVAPILVTDWQDAPAAHHRLPTVLIPEDAYLAQADEDSLKGLDAVQERLQGLGVTVQRVNILPDIEDINRAHQDMIAADFARVHELWFEEYGDRYQERSRELIERGRAITAERHVEAVKYRKEIRARLEAALRRHDATFWLAPATVGDAPHGIHATGSPIMNLPWTYAGVPTVSLPIIRLPHGMGAHGLPLGVQIAGPSDSDETLLARAVLLENALR